MNMALRRHAEQDKVSNDHDELNLEEDRVTDQNKNVNVKLKEVDVEIYKGNIEQVERNVKREEAYFGCDEVPVAVPLRQLEAVLSEQFEFPTDTFVLLIHLYRSTRLVQLRQQL